MLTGPLQFCEISHLLHAPRQFRAGLCRAVDLFCIRQRLLRSHGAYPGLAHLRDLFDHVGAELHPGLRDLAARNDLALRQRQQIQQTKRQQAVQFKLGAKACPLKSEERVGNAAGLVGLRHVGPALGQQGLHGRAVGQSQLHCVVHAQGLGQQLAAQLAAGLPLLLGAAQLKLALGEGLGAVVGCGNCLINIDRSAACQHQVARALNRKIVLIVGSFTAWRVRHADRAWLPHLAFALAAPLWRTRATPRFGQPRRWLLSS